MEQWCHCFITEFAVINQWFYEWKKRKRQSQHGDSKLCSSDCEATVLTTAPLASLTYIVIRPPYTHRARGEFLCKSL